MLSEYFALEKDDYQNRSPEICKAQEYSENLKHRKFLSRLNFHMFWIILLVLILIVLDNSIFLKSTKTAIPVDCLRKDACAFKIRFANPGGKNLVYLEFENFNQNFKDYAASFSPKVFKDEVNPSSTVVRSCKPLLTNYDMGKSFNWEGDYLYPNATAVPCGAIAYTFPNSK
jgi:LEM3 (ligand-effect modulator 3) family / CDC50 family